MAAAAANPDMLSQHDVLIAMVATLSAQLATITDATQAKQVMLEMQQITSRANLLQSLLFAAQTAAITKQAASLTKAKASLQKAIDTHANWTAVVAGINSMLAVADNTIQLAKAAMV
jgi:hypothetical protein